MLSKQEKLKYGQILRQQMKEKQEKKKAQYFQKKGIRRNLNQQKSQKQNNTQVNKKESLQRKFQNINYGPFGKPGGGAPNHNNERNNQQINPINSYQPQLQKNQIQYNNPNVKIKTQEPDSNVFQRQQNTSQLINEYPPKYQSPPIKRQAQQYYPQNRQYTQQYYPSRQFPNNHYIQPPVNDYYPLQYQQYNQSIPPNYRNPYQLHQPIERQRIYPYQQPYPYQNKIQLYQQIQKPETKFPTKQQNDHQQKKYQQLKKTKENYRKLLQNQQITQIHKKGGRNLLQLQNITAQQHLIKQKQKLQMQKQLKLQIEEVQKRKKQQKQKRQKQQRQQQIKNQQYLKKQKQKLLEQERKKNQKQKQIIEQNMRNLQQRKKLQQEAKLKAKQLKNRSFQNKTPPIQKVQHQKKQTFSRQAQFQVSDQTQSQGTSSTIMEQAFNTDVSKQFFQRQKRRDQQRYNRQKNIQVVTEQIKKMRDQIDKQNQLFKRQIDKVKLQSQMAEIQKRKAQHQIQNLKEQLKKKMEDDNQRLFLALQRQQKYKIQDEIPNKKTFKKKQQNYYEDQYENEFEKQIPKAKKNQTLIKKNILFLNNNVSENGLQSLHGQSKKIPLNIDDPKLSMSKLSDYARQTKYFKNPQNKKIKYQIQGSILQQQQQKIQSRVVKKNKYKKLNNQHDQLDKMIQSRQKSRGGWGQMSSVNSDITKQIQQLLKKKQNNNNKQRPSSHLSNAGRQTLSRHGMQYEGQSLATINLGENTTINTNDVNKIHKRNEARLNQLRNLGVQTINTNNDQEFSKLDQILNKYKQDRSRIL